MKTIDDGAFKPVPVRRPREQVEAQIRAAILGGEFGPGDRLPSEAVLARDFGVSRSTVREALRALSEAGLITTSPGAAGGSFVEGIDHQALGARFGESVENNVRLGSLTHAEVAAVRRLLEIPSARLAARSRSDEQLAQLDEAIEEQGRIASGTAARELNTRFHEAIAEASGNRLLAAMISALHRAQPRTATDISPEVRRRSAKHHRRIVAAIRERDEETAAAAMEDDVREFGQAAPDSQ